MQFDQHGNRVWNSPKYMGGAGKMSIEFHERERSVGIPWGYNPDMTFLRATKFEDPADYHNPAIYPLPDPRMAWAQYVDTAISRNEHTRKIE